MKFWQLHRKCADINNSYENLCLEMGGAVEAVGANLLLREPDCFDEILYSVEF